MSVKKQLDIKAVVILALSVAGIFSLFMLRDLPDDFQNSEKDRPNKVVISYCDVAETCSARMEDARVELAIKPASMPVMRPLDIVVTISGLKAQRVTFEFTGRDMPMKLGQTVLNRNGYSLDQERYTGSGMISFCSSDNDMVWLARINITTKTEIQTVVFELDASRS